MTNHYVLVWLTAPEDLSDFSDEGRRWLSLLGNIETHKELNDKSTRIGENCWLLPRDNGVEALALLVGLSKKSSVAFSVKFLTQD